MDDDADDDADPRTFSWSFNTRTIPETVHDDPVFHYRVNLEMTTGDQKHYAISDGGADGCMGGRNCHETGSTGRYATVVGVHNEAIHRIPICSFYMKVLAHNGIPVLLHVHNSPLNTSSNVSIISEYQVRDFGLIIDSISERHPKGPNEFGTQRFQLNDVIHAKFVDIGALMALEVLPYEEGEIGRAHV